MAKQSTVSETLPQSAIDFLKAMSENNNREWFGKHKAQFQQEQEHIANFAEGILRRLNQHDEIETPSGKASLYRIYRDTRFSQDKTPYKTNWSGGFKRATRQRRGSYYFQIEPGNSFVAGGFWGPVPQDLRRIREDIAFDAGPLRKILSNAAFRSSFGSLAGEQLKTAPKGYEATHEAIDLLRYKQFLLIRRFSDEEVVHTSFPGQVDKTFKHMRPFLNYMSEVLTTDTNGLELQ
jgi:uncharacterized protein (TIGR02453 family)